MFESCKAQCHCCELDYGSPKLITEPNQSIESDSESEEVSSEICDINQKVEIPQNIINMKINTDDLVLAREGSPWKNYEKELELGSGTYGSVIKACLIKNKSLKRAIKVIPKDNLMEGIDDNKSFLDEINILKKLDHPNIMKLYETYMDEKNFYLVSDLCDQGDLLGKMKKLGRMNQIVVKVLMDQIFNAVAYLHLKHVLHGDIKLENILLYTSTQNKGKRFTLINQDINSNFGLQQEINRTSSKRSRNYVNDMLNYEVKLIDFGCSKYFVKKDRHRKLSGIIGTSIYCSPEVIDDKYDELCDEWACGVLMYILLSGKPPFQGNTEEEIFANIKKCKYDLSSKIFFGVSDNCKDLIRKLLEPNRKKRIKAGDALKHPFFTELFNSTKAMRENKDLTILNRVIGIKKLTSKFHESISAFLCNNFINIDEEKKLREVFRYMDNEEKNGLSIDNLQKGLMEIGVNLPDNELNDLFVQLDKNQSGLIEYQEFLSSLCDKKSLITEDNLRNTFNAINFGDKDYISSDDIKNFIFHDTIVPDNTFKEYLEQFGMVKDATISFEEFFDMIKNNKSLNKINECENNKENENKAKLNMGILEKELKIIPEQDEDKSTSRSSGNKKLILKGHLDEEKDKEFEERAIKELNEEKEENTERIREEGENKEKEVKEAKENKNKEEQNVELKEEKKEEQNTEQKEEQKEEQNTEQKEEQKEGQKGEKEKEKNEVQKEEKEKIDTKILEEKKEEEKKKEEKGQ